MSTLPTPPRDALGRGLTDLRISVTDRCNFRCTFCMPAHHRYTFLPRSQILTFEEIVRLAGIFVDLGVRKIRLTGGEPLLRNEIEVLIRQLRMLDGLEDLALTTNAYLLADKAGLLEQAGLDRVTVSLHSLDPELFGQINGLGLPLQTVLDGITAALDAGLGPVKANVVVMKGVNDGEIEALARYGRSTGSVIRFIEYMDVGTVNAWDPEKVLTAQEIVDRIDAIWPIEPLGKVHVGDVAERYRYLDGGGEIGVIPSISQPFCGDCTRARLSAEGRVYTCLFGAVGHDLASLLRSDASDTDLREALVTLWQARNDRYSEARTEALHAGRFAPAEKVEMFRIGG